MALILAVLRGARAHLFPEGSLTSICGGHKYSVFGERIPDPRDFTICAACTRAAKGYLTDYEARVAQFQNKKRGELVMRGLMAAGRDLRGRSALE